MRLSEPVNMLVVSLCLDILYTVLVRVPWTCPLFPDHGLFNCLPMCKEACRSSSLSVSASWLQAVLWEWLTVALLSLSQLLWPLLIWGGVMQLAQQQVLYWLVPENSNPSSFHRRANPTGASVFSFHKPLNESTDGCPLTQTAFSVPPPSVFFSCSPKSITV